MFQGPAGLEAGGPYLEEGVILISPAKPREIEQNLSFLDLTRRIRPPQAAKRVSAVENQMAHALRMPSCVFDCDRAPLAGGNQRKARKIGGLDHTFEITHPSLERKIAGVAVRKSAAAGVVAQHLVLACEDVQPRPPGKAAPLMFKMRQPTRRHHQRWPFAAHRIGELYAVGSRAESDLLVHGGKGRSHPVGVYSRRSRGASLILPHGAPA